MPDQFTFALPLLLLCGIAAAVGIASLRGSSWVPLVSVCLVSCVVQAAAYAVLPSLLAGVGCDLEREVARPFRDEMRYWITPWKHNEDSAARFSSQAIAGVPPGSVILTDGTARYPLLIARHRRQQVPALAVRSFTALRRYADNREAWDQLARDGRLFTVSPKLDAIPAQLDGRVRYAAAASGALHRIWWSVPAGE